MLPKQYVLNTNWMMFEKIVRIIALLLISVFVARYLGPEGFGQLNYAIAIALIASIFINLGLDSLVVRELVKTPKLENKILGSVALLKVIGALVMFSGLYTILYFFPQGKSTDTMIMVISLSYFLGIIFDVINLKYQAEVKVKFVVYIQMIQVAFLVTLTALGIYYKVGILWFAFLYLIDKAILSLGVFIIFKAQGGNIWSYKYDPKVIKQLIQDGWPAILSAIFGLIYMQIDQVMIKNMLNAHELGIYSAAVRISTGWYFIPMVITASLMPMLVKKKKEGQYLYDKFIQLLHDSMFILAFLVAIPITFYGDWIMELLYGSLYDGAGEILVIHIWSAVFVFLGIAGGRWYVNENLILLSSIRHLLGLIVNIALNYYWIPLFGIQGAAVATLISYFCSSYIFDLINKKSRPIFYIKSKSIFYFGSSLLLYGIEVFNNKQKNK